MKRSNLAGGALVVFVLCGCSAAGLDAGDSSGGSADGGKGGSGTSNSGGSSGAGTIGVSGAAGTAAANGSGGNSAAGGAAGSGGNSSTGGGTSGGTGGIGGDPVGAGGGAAAAGGSGGAGVVAQCVQDTDCKLFEDCCTCAAYPKAATAPNQCDAACKLGACNAHGIVAASCVASRCIAGFACNTKLVYCAALPPKCASGQVPSVIGGCWGPCVEATQCADVSSCADCTHPSTTCVVLGGKPSGPLTHHCVSILKGSEKESSS